MRHLDATQRADVLAILILIIVIAVCLVAAALAKVGDWWEGRR
jgi:hypothetical protein